MLDEQDAAAAFGHDPLEGLAEERCLGSVQTRRWLVQEEQVERSGQASGEFDESAFEGTGVFILGAVLEQFFARYVSLNSFTETVIRTQQRGELMRWKPQLGKRQLI